jgi:hypothetical protein
MHFALIVHSFGDFKMRNEFYGIAIDFIVLKFAHKHFISACLPDPQSMILVALKFAFVSIFCGRPLWRPLEAKPALLVV